MSKSLLKKIALGYLTSLFLYLIFIYLILFNNGGTLNNETIAYLHILLLIFFWTIQFRHSIKDIRQRNLKNNTIWFYLLTSLLNISLTALTFYLLTVSFALGQLFGGSEFVFDEFLISIYGIIYCFIGLIFFSIYLLTRIIKKNS